MLQSMGFQVNRVEIPSLELTRNMVYKVWIENSPYAFKIYRDDPFGHYSLKIDHLREVHRITRLLSDEFPFVNGPVNELIKTPVGWGTFFQWIDGFSAVRDLKKLNEEQCRNFGMDLGQLYLFLSKIPNDLHSQDQLFFKPLPDFIKSIANHQPDRLNMSPETLSIFQTWANKIMERIPDQPFGIVHGDLHPFHYQLDENGRIKSLIDWDSMRVDIPSGDFFGMFRYLTSSRLSGFLEGLFRFIEPADPNDFKLIFEARYLRTTFFLVNGGIIEEAVVPGLPPWATSVLETYADIFRRMG